MDGLIAYILSKKYTNTVKQEILDAGFTVQVEEDRSILEGQGQEKILYLLPKEDSSQDDSYDEYIYANNQWEFVGTTGVDLSEYATKAEVGDLTQLITTDKSSIVAAINEIANIPDADVMQF